MNTSRRRFCALLVLTSLFAVTSPSPRAAPASTGEQTIIYARGGSLWFQALDGTPAREEKLELPKGAQIQSLTSARDGKTLAFEANKTIYFYDTKVKTLTPLAPKAGGKFTLPSISPDGQSVACRPYRADATLTILSRDGTARDLGASTQGITTSRWTPDGNTIYFATGPNLYRINASSDTVAQAKAELFLRGHYVEKFSINVREQIIAPIPVDNSAVKPFIIDAQGQKTALNFEPTDFYAPTWNPDGTAIIFARRARYGGQNDAIGIYIWENIASQQEPRKISDAPSNAESGFVWQ